MKIGILGGTFDPVHNGHILIARYALQKLVLDKVLFMPARLTPMKYRPDISPVEHRVEMLRLALKGESRMELSTLEVERPGTSYTVDTLAELRSGLADRDEIFFLIGWDALNEFPQWKEPRKIISLCKLTVFPRPHVPLPDLEKLEKEIPGIKDRIIMLDFSPVDISSTMVRERVAQGLPIVKIVPQPVAEYIEKNRLYI